MKRNIVWTAAFGLLLASGAAFLRLGYSPAARAQPGCSIETLQGTFGIHIQGWTPGSNASLPGIPFAQVGLLAADGAGGVRLVVTSNSGGQVSKDTFTYSYQVNPDCTGSLTPAPGIMAGPADFVVVNGGKEMLLVVTMAQQGMVLSGQAIRQQ